MPIHCFVRGFCFSCLDSEIIQVSLYHFPTSLGLKYQHTSPLYQLLSCSPPLIIKPPVEIISANRQGITIPEAKGTCVLQENASYFQNHPGFQFLGIGNFKLSWKGCCDDSVRHAWLADHYFIICKSHIFKCYFPNPSGQFANFTHLKFKLCYWLALCPQGH